jgi:chromate transporter
MILLELFLVFFSIGLFTFGGGYAMVPILKTEVLSRGWMDEALFIDFISISESTPGPLALNMATFIGTEVNGISGALVATLGVMLPSIVIIMLVAAVFNKAINHPLTQAALKGIKPVVMALIAATILFLLRNLLFPTTISWPLIDISHLVLLINLGSFYFGYRYLKKKPLHPMILIGVAAIAGIIMFSF